MGRQSFVLKIVEHGYFLCFISLPPPPLFGNSVSAYSNSNFVSKQVVSLLRSGAAEETSPEELVIVSPLGVVPKKSGKLRLILDLRYLNLFLANLHFSFEDLRVVPHLFSPQCFMFTFDLKDGYHHISIAEPHRKFLGFSWSLNGQTRFFSFCGFALWVKTSNLYFHQGSQAFGCTLA